MALKSSREGLRKELVDYLGNIIIDENLKQNIINSVDDVFVNNEELSTSVNELDDKIRNETSARESADNTLQNNINVESTARQEAISTIEDLINNGVLKLDLLWTNANVYSIFESQTISLDLSKYKLVGIKYVHWYGNSNIQSRMNIHDKNSIYQSGMSNYKNQYNVREINSITDTGIAFGNGFAWDGNGGINNETAIPYKIYGVN